MYMKLADKHDAFENIVVMYPPRKVVWDFILIQKIARKKSILILHQSLTCARPNNAMQPKGNK